MGQPHGNHGVGGSTSGQHTQAGHSLISKIAAVATPAATAVCTHTGRGIMSNFFRHPLVLIGIGAAAGFYAHKYRKEIIGYTSSVTGMSKDFVLQQKENLEDLVAEGQEAEEAVDSATKAKSPGKSS